ncbi:hypothetical protein MPSI1_003398 [Malassezia psittaci]|uniref:Mannosyltransferase n=1 Tax=Malassezia psittaci TaxID=1821823 RepID=A0AAF0JFG9_9BASI|nr:hypothetical protein MPSI1_003398 [Malassezia psittaci]
MLRLVSLRYLLVTLIAVLSLNALLLWQGHWFTTSSSLPLTTTLSGARLAHYVTQRPNAVIYALVRNSELGSLLQTIQDMEHNFNAHPDTRYPYPFTERFKRHVSAATQSPVYYGLVPQEQWAVPASVNLTYAKTIWQSLRNQHVAYADSQSYRQMCRYQSGHFMNHALMKPFDYYWRIEPGVSYFCRMFDSDPFRVMRDQNKKYGWVITLRDE